MNKFLNWKGHSVIALITRIYIGFVFISACYHKIISPQSFALDIAVYQILPLSLINLMAIILPWIELGSGITIILGFKTKASAFLICGMMVMFIIALIIALSKGLDISCGCFASSGIESDPISYKTVFRDLIWLIMGVYILLLDKNPLGLDRFLYKKEMV